MADYGLTGQGPNIKRLDVILEEMHEDLSEAWGVNTQQNPESLLNHLLTNVADQIAELWEFGEHVYYSQYPASAEGTSLDNAAQYGGSTREAAAKSYYPIHCTGVDGTTLASGTMISSTTNPTTYLSITEDKTISRSDFNKATIKVATASEGDIYTVALNGSVYSSTSTSDDSSEILEGLAEVITDDDFTITLDEDEALLYIEAVDTASSNVLVLSDSLTTENVTTIINFGTVETGDIYLPAEVITNIVKADAGLLAVTNICSYIAGQDEETDAEFRLSYADKIFNRGKDTLESIRSAILQNVQGVASVAAYENATNEYDDYGRPPHSVEMVVQGGSSTEIAQQILIKKAGGITAYGDTSVVLSGEYDEDITISFSRPTLVYVWFHLGITLSTSESIPSNYVDLLRNVVVDHMSGLDCGTDVIPQEFVSEFFDECPGITYVDVTMYVTTDSSEVPSSYSLRSAEITARQLAYTSADMIEVDIDG